MEARLMMEACLYVEKLFISLFRKEARKSQKNRKKPNEIFGNRTE